MHSACGGQRRCVIDGEHLRCVFTKCRINCARVCVVVRTAQHDDGFYKKARASDRAWTVVDPVRTTSLLSMNFISVES